MRAVSGTRRFASPVTTPSSLCLPVLASAFVTLRLPAVSFRRLTLTPRGSVTRTSASPPDTRLARGDRTLMVGACVRAPAGAAASATAAQTDSMIAVPLRTAFIDPLRPVPELPESYRISAGGAPGRVASVARIQQARGELHEAADERRAGAQLRS